METKNYSPKITPEKIMRRALITNAPQDFNLLIDLCMTDTDKYVQHLRDVMKHAAAEVTPDGNPFAIPKSFTAIQEWREVYWRAMRVAARSDFDSFCIYLERYREPEEKFYAPRRKILYKLMSALNALETGDLQELLLNMPSRVGKSTLLLFFFIWTAGRNPERTNLYCAHSAGITDKFYDGVLEIVTDKVHYAYDEIFPDSPMVSKHADETTIDFGREKRYPTLTCRSLHSDSLNGACDARGYIISDDLISGTEEARSTARLQTAQQLVSNNLMRRGVGANLKLIWCGTPWSVRDPMSNRIRALETDPVFKNRKWLHIKLPGVDPETGESNFDYDYGLGFTTQQFAEVRADFEANDDLASWETQVQCNPMEYHGLLFPDSSLKTYTDEPDEEDRVRTFMYCDPAWGGGDYVSAPVCKRFICADGTHRDLIVDVVFDNGEKTVTQPMIVEAIKRNGVGSLIVEANKMTREYADGVAAMLRASGVRCNVSTKPAKNNTAKDVRIWENAPEIRELEFLAKDKRHPQYKKFMENVNSYNPTGKNAHDDGPDSLSGLVDEMDSGGMPSVQVGTLWK